MRHLLLGLICFFLSTNKSYSKTIEGSFLQFGGWGDEEEILNWGSKEWDREFAYMQDIGINELIIQWTVHEYRDSVRPHPVLADSSFYPSGLDWVDGCKVDFDLIDTILSVCDARNMKVYLGLLGEVHVWMPFEDTQELEDYASDCIAIANELYQKYSSHPSFHGWYIPYEFNNWIQYTIDYRTHYLDQLGHYWKQIVDTCHSLKPGSPVFISPYFHPEPLNTFSQWCDTFALRCKNWGLDAVAFMDCVGAGFCPLDSVDDYFQHINSAFQNTGVAFWSDLEIFQDTTIFVSYDSIVDTLKPGIPTNIDRVITQIDTESPLVDKIVCFEFNYFMSPSKALWPEWEFSFHLRSPKLYNDYRRHFWNIKNIAYQKSYTISEPTVPYTDPGTSIITDGVISFDLEDSLYVGWSGGGSDTITINLDNIYLIKDVRIYTKSESTSCVFPPESLGIYGSTDGISYTYIGAARDFGPDASAVIPFCWIGSPVEAKFIKCVIVPRRNEWRVVCEVEAFGVPAWGSDHEGENWTIATNTTIDGWHWNIDTFTINSGVTVNVVPYDDSDTTGMLIIEAQEMNILGTLSANEAGYESSEGPGAGMDSPTGNRYGAGGAGYGGKGGRGNHPDSSYSKGGSTYGDTNSPDRLGSGGGNDCYRAGCKGTTYYVYGGKGGGFIKLECGGCLMIDGQISANGDSGTTGGYDPVFDVDHASGGGSGGSIWLVCDSLTGTGTITANGGNGGASTFYSIYGGGGAGGRICVAMNVDSFTGTVSVDGGAEGGVGAEVGEDGTIYLPGDGGGQLIELSAPIIFKLHQNYPNPFVKSTTIKYQLPVKSKVSLRIYDVAGRCVKTLIDGEKSIGYYKVKWDGKGLSTGIYFAKFKAGDYKSTKKLILMR